MVWKARSPCAVEMAPSKGTSAVEVAARQWGRKRQDNSGRRWRKQRKARAGVKEGREKRMGRVEMEGYFSAQGERPRGLWTRGEIKPRSLNSCGSSSKQVQALLPSACSRQCCKASPALGFAPGRNSYRRLWDFFLISFQQRFISRGARGPAAPLTAQGVTHEGPAPSCEASTWAETEPGCIQRVLVYAYGTCQGTPTLLIPDPAWLFNLQGAALLPKGSMSSFREAGGRRMQCQLQQHQEQRLKEGLSVHVCSAGSLLITYPAMNLSHC